MRRFDPIADLLTRPQSTAIMQARLATQAPPGAPDACWPWTGPTNADGYGRTRSEDGLEILTHRLAFALEAGRSPGEMNVLHSCDNPPCRNPAHLYEGTNADNVADRVRRGRSRGAACMSGEVNPAVKLDGDDVVAIRARIAAGETNVEIARNYPVGHAQISRIRRGLAWAPHRSESGNPGGNLGGAEADPSPENTQAAEIPLRSSGGCGRD